jgi:chromosome segregation ATPase
LAALADEGVQSSVAATTSDQEVSVERLYELLDHTTSRNAELLKHKSELAQALQDKEAHHRSLAGELQKTRDELAARHANMTDIQSALDETRQRLEQRQSELASATAALAAAERAFDDKKIQLTAAMRALDERQGKLIAVEGELEVRGAALSRAQEEVTGLRLAITGLEAALDKVVADAAAKQRQIAELETQKATLADDFVRLKQQIQQLESRLLQRDEEISQTLRELTSVKLQLAQASAKAEDLAAANAQLGAQRDSQDAAITALEERALRLEQDKAETEKQLKQSEQWVFRLAGLRTEHERDFAKLTRLLADERKQSGKEAVRNMRADEEIARLRRTLEEIETGYRAKLAETAQSHGREIAERFDELAQLTRMLRHADAELAADKRRQSAEAAEASHKHAVEIAERYEELATMTRMLRETERKLQAGHASFDVTKQIALALETMPWWWSLLPQSMRDKRKFARLRRRGLFDGERYLQMYPDVGAERMDPLVHYLRHGMAEGRSSATE